MERILTAEQMHDADHFTISKLGIPEEVLIDRAGNALAEEILKRFKGGRVLVCVGKGNNGKDGEVLAKILSLHHGFAVSVISVDGCDFSIFDKKFDIIVDCIFGTGLNREVTGIYKEFIKKINKSNAYKISCDIPSGINGNNGTVLGDAVRADLTIAIGEYKLGLFLNDGIDYSGEVKLKDIGISVWGDDFVKRITDNSLSNLFKKRNRNIHKGINGKCALIGGSKIYSGSIVLSAYALSAFKMGVGYVNMLVPENMFNNYVGKVPECILTAVKDDGDKMVLDKDSLNRVFDYDSIAVGMGMTDSEDTYKIARYLIENYTGKLIIDADGLNAISKYGKDLFKNKKCEVILTPHVKEFSRLADKSVCEILDNPIDIAKNFAQENGVIVVLKNAVSVITDGNEVYINTTGSQGMAKAGSGDILSGFMCGLVAREREDSLFAVVGANYLFGLAGEIAEKEQNEFSMTASDIIQAIPKAINKLIII